MGSTPAQARTALVLGGGMSGLLSARELASAGYQVTVLEAGTEWGGCVGSHTVAGLTLDSGAESFATRSDTCEQRPQAGAPGSGKGGLCRCRP